MELVKIEDEITRQRVWEEMTADNHSIPYFDTYIDVNGQVYGAFSEHCFPYVALWFNQKYWQGIVIMRVYKAIKSLANEKGYPRIYLLCAKESNIYPYIRQYLGDSAETQLFQVNTD